MDSDDPFSAPVLPPAPVIDTPSSIDAAAAVTVAVAAAPVAAVAVAVKPKSKFPVLLGAPPPLASLNEKKAKTDSARYLNGLESRLKQARSGGGALTRKLAAAAAAEADDPIGSDGKRKPQTAAAAADASGGDDAHVNFDMLRDETSDEPQPQTQTRDERGSSDDEADAPNSAPRAAAAAAELQAAVQAIRSVQPSDVEPAIDSTAGDSSDSAALSSLAPADFAPLTSASSTATATATAAADGTNDFLDLKQPPQQPQTTSKSAAATARALSANPKVQRYFNAAPPTAAAPAANTATQPVAAPVSVSTKVRASEAGEALIPVVAATTVAGGIRTGSARPKRSSAAAPSASPPAAAPNSHTHTVAILSRLPLAASADDEPVFDHNSGADELFPLAPSAAAPGSVEDRCAACGQCVLSACLCCVSRGRCSCRRCIMPRSALSPCCGGVRTCVIL